MSISIERRGWFHQAISVDGQRYRVPRHEFWTSFADGWEQSTIDLYRSIVRPGDTVVDIGAWIGPTALLARSRGARRIVLVEPNPVSVRLLRKTVRLNPDLARTWEICPVALSDVDGEVAFGSRKGKRLKASSATSLRGTGTTVRSVRFQTFWRDHLEKETSPPRLVKIDVEGAETTLFPFLADIVNAGSVVWLSLHPPFWTGETHLVALEAMLGQVALTDADGRPVEADEILRRCRSSDQNPDWGTAHGNFFEVALRPVSDCDKFGVQLGW